MLSITVAQLRSDIAGKMKGTSVKEVKDFYGTAGSAANRMLARIDPQETIRIVTMSTPFFDNVQDYALVTDFKRMIDIRPQANRINQPGLAIFSETTPRQFLTRLDSNSFSIKWNSGQRSIRSQRLPAGDVLQMDSFDSTTSNGLWGVSGDISGLRSEVLNYVEGSASLAMDLSGSTGTGYIENTTATVADLSTYYYEDSSFLYFWIPVGYSSKFTSFALRRGTSANSYVEATTTTKADGTAFNDGWNFLKFDWVNSIGYFNAAPVSTIMRNALDNTKNTYRRLTVNTVAGTSITSCLVDNWTNSLGNLYEIEYYSECMFRTAAGAWIYAPTADSDFVNVGPNSYEILKAEMMIDIVQQIRIGNVLTSEINEWRLMLNGQPQTRYVKDPPYHGLYSDYNRQFPSSAIVTQTKTYDFDC